MKPLNTKIYFKILPEDKQPVKSIFVPDAEMLKFVEVMDTGDKVLKVKENDVLTLYVTTIQMLTQTTGFCTERDVIFINNYPQENKIHISANGKDNSLSIFKKGKVIKSSSSDISDSDLIYYKDGQTHILPDGSEIISESQVYYKD